MFFLWRPPPKRSYLLKADGKVVERPQHMIMRVAVGIHKEDIDKVIETYDLMSQRLFTHATPTLFNAGTPKPQMSSCFLLTMKEDSISGIYDTLKQVSKAKQLIILVLVLHFCIVYVCTRESKDNKEVFQRRQNTTMVYRGDVR